MSAEENTEVKLINVPILVNIHDIAVFMDQLGIFKRLKEGFIDELIKSLRIDLCR